MPTETLAKYLNTRRLQEGLTYEAVANKCNIPEPTIKNLCTGKTKNPGLETIIPVIEAVGGSFDEMLHPEQNKDEVKETSILALKDIYEFQIATLKENHKEEIQSIRTHYEQHHQDLVDNFEKRLADKREIIEMQKKENLASKIVAWVCGSILVILLIAEVMNPSLGWLRF